MPFPHTVASVEELRTMYREPHPVVVDKEKAVIDEATRTFVERATFAAVGTFDEAGAADVSPRGGPSGFIRVLDERRLLIADLGGNNRLDTLENIIATGQIALLIVHPGKSETVRVNGRACITRDPDLLSGFGLPRTPVTAIGVEVVGTFIHCAKAFMRSGMWDPDTWAALTDAPDAADIIECQTGGAFAAQVVRDDLAGGYAEALAWERSSD